MKNLVSDLKTLLELLAPGFDLSRLNQYDKGFEPYKVAHVVHQSQADLCYYNHVSYSRRNGLLIEGSSGEYRIENIDLLPVLYYRATVFLKEDEDREKGKVLRSAQRSALPGSPGKEWSITERYEDREAIECACVGEILRKTALYT